MMNYLKKATAATLLLLLSISIGAMPVAATSEASIRISAPTTVTVGSSVNVTVTLNTLDAPIDTARIVVNFPKDLLKAEYVKHGVLFPNQSPANAIDNTKGIVTWGGFNIDGVQKRGTFATITFRALKSGTANIEIANATLLLKAGEKVPYQSINATIDAQSQKKNLEVSQKITIESITHPSQDSWYQESSPTFSWNKLDEKQTFLIGLSTDPAEVPTTKTELAEKKYENLDEGVWYFSLLPSGSEDVMQYVVRIDRTAPSTITPIIDIQGLQDGASIIKVQFNTIDNISGVKNYEVKLDDGVFEPATSPLTIKDYTPETSRITVRAYDGAGNISENTSSIEPDLKTLTAIPSELKKSSTNYFTLINILTLAVLVAIIIAIGVYVWKRNKK